ncbi:MAG: copper homeostasis membrane protein CopD [Vulcanimicrobiaceae bacterium]|jgi:putative copper resistance protein D
MDPLLIVTRTLHYAATASLEGLFVFWCFIAIALPERIDRRLIVIGWVSWCIALVSGIAWFFVVSSNMSGTPISGLIQGGVLGIVLAQTQFGVDWQVRAALLAGIAICLAIQIGSWKTVARWIGLPISAAFIASLAWAGHGAAAEEIPFDALHLPADLLHLIAAGAWLGALPPLAMFFAGIWRDGNAESLSVAGRVTSRFSILGITCVTTLLVTGILNTWFLSGTVAALLGTLYGQLLLLKVAFFAAMIAIARVNLLRLSPLLEQAQRDASAGVRAIRRLCRNASTEASFGFLVLAIVGIIGTLPPGSHTEPRWPLPFRIDFAEIAPAALKLVDVFSVLFFLCLVAVVVTAERQRYRGIAASLAALVVCGVIGGIALRPGIVTAYPTTYFASTQPYSAPSVAHGAPLFMANCTICHGADGRGDGPLATKLSIRPADLTEEHIFAHKAGDVFWWISYGLGGVMPGFADKLTPTQRWDVINFVLARAAGVQVGDVGPQISASAAPPLPDFAFEQRGGQNTLSQTLKTGPVLLVLFAPRAPEERLAQLATLKGITTLAVDVAGLPSAAPLVVNVSADVRNTLELFRSPKDGSETELMLDRNGSVRARWTATAGLADATTLSTDAVRVARIPAAAANHAGHGG